MAEEMIGIKHFEDEETPDFYLIFTRTEAIEKISSALLMRDLSTMDHKEIAEVALNALLEK